MPKTAIADVIVPAVFNPYVIQRTAALSAFYQSGIISNNPELDALASSGGQIVNMPFWNDLSGASQVLSDTGALTVNKITSDQDKAVLLMRGQAWSVNDLAKALSGDDPMGAVANLVGGYWAREFQTITWSVLKGVFAAASMSGNVKDISGQAGALAVLTGNTFLDAQALLGDSAEKLTAVSMHSAAYTKLQQDNLIAFIPDSEGKVNIPTYMGRRVIVDDGSPNSAGVYTSYLFGAGALGHGNGAAPVPTETDRDSLAGDDILINRNHFLLHPRGVKFNSASVAGSSPTNTELEAAANWTRVYENKNVRIVKFVYKLA